MVFFREDAFRFVNSKFLPDCKERVMFFAPIFICSPTVKKPSAYKYMKLLRFTLRGISSWPGKELGEKQLFFEGKKYDWYTTLLSILFFIMSLWYLVENISSLAFMELGHIYIVLLLNCLATARAFTLCLSPKYRIVAKNFLERIHLFYHKEKSEYARKIYAQVHRFSEIYTMYIISAMSMALLLFSFTPVYNNWAKGKFKVTKLVNTTYEHLCYFKLPWNPYDNLRGYIFGSFVDWYAAYLCGCCVNMFDLFLSLMVFNLWGHFKILINILGTFPKPASMRDSKNCNLYSRSEQNNAHLKLKDCILYHREISDFTNNMSDAFGLALLAFYMFHQVAGCLMLLECSQMSAEALFRYGPLTTIMTAQLIQTSIIFETIGTMSEKLKDAVYTVPWEYMDSKNRSTFLLFFTKVQEPIHVKAGGMINVGVTTMASILKTSFSYFAFLRTFSE